MTQRQFGTLRHVFESSPLRESELRVLHAGTLRSMFQNAWIYAFVAHGVTWIALTTKGVDALEYFRTAGPSLRNQEADLTACTVRLLKLARMRKKN